VVDVWTTPALATTNAIISSSDANVDKANLRFFHQFVSNPAGSNLALISSGTTGAAFNLVPDAAFVNQKVNQVNPQYSTFGSALDKGSGAFDIAAGDPVAPNASGDSWLLIQNRHWNWSADYRWQLTCQFTDPDQIFSRMVLAGVGGTWRRIFHSGMDGAGSGIDADLLDGVQGSGYAPIANQVPSGLGGFFATAAGIPAGWTRYTNGDGRLLVGAGTTFSVTFTENTAVGSNWTPFSGQSVFSATAADVTGAATAGSAFSAPSHQHSVTLSAQTWTPVATVVVFAIKN